MKNLLFLLAFALAVSATAVQAVTVGASSVAIQGGSNSWVVWRAPLSQTYKVSVFVTNSGTGTHALYRVHPKGKCLPPAQSVQARTLIIPALKFR